MCRKLYRYIALLCCFVMLAAIVPLAFDAVRPAYADAADDLKELNQKYEQLEKDQKELQSKIDQAKNDKEKQLAIKAQTSGEITILQSQISVLQEKIALMEQEIARKEEEIAGLNNDISDSYQLFKDRMRAIYMTDTGTTLGLVLGADSYGDYLVQSETVKRVAERDRQLIADLNSDLANMESIKAALDAERSDLDAAKLSVEAKNRELDSRLATTVSNIQSLDQMEKEFLANKVELQKQMQEVQAEIDDIYEKLQALEEDYVGGMFMQPVPGYSKITSYYGPRFGGSDYHTGIDISGTNILGKKVVAANSGQVTYTQNSFVPGRGYGRYMIVDHGGGYSTLYAHLSAITAWDGTRVSKGSAIAKVGSTGWSTGPHLHFEVRIDGKHQNPLNYLS